MSEDQQQISSAKVKQVFFLLILIGLSTLIVYNLAAFIPALLGALTLYVVCRRYIIYLIEVKDWKPWLAATVLMLATLVVLVLPVYFLIDKILERLGHMQEYMTTFNGFVDKVHDFVYSKTRIDVLSTENLAKLKEMANSYMTSAIGTTLNAFTSIVAMYFILYFLLIAPRRFETLLRNAAPLKKGNVTLIGEKIRRMIIANAVGIPVVALGQAIAGVIGYYIFGAPNPWLLFVLTFIGSMLPVVGAAIIYIPVTLFMMANGDTGSGIGLLIYSVVVVGLIDNVLRFTFLKKLENIHPLNTVFGIIMGINIFGFIGLIFGPILVSVTVLLIRVYRDEFSEDAVPELVVPEDDDLDDNVDLIV
ncbi:MAG: AI-2E family transporter [Chryseobacterium sp.]|nr:MAG: AI-2E family transporter [Chryseobacterium sp.]